MKRRWPASLWLGFLLLLGAFFALPVLAWFPPLRNYAWPSFVLLGAGGILFVAGLVKSFRHPQVYRGKVFGSILGILSLMAALFFTFGIFYLGRTPLPAAVPQVGQRVPEFELRDQDNKTVRLKELLSTPASDTSPPPKGVLLVFYRGHW